MASHPIPQAAETEGPNETTPLLPTSERGAARPGTAKDDHEADRNGRPLPKQQIFLLCYARVVEPIAFFAIFPFVNQMVQQNGHLAEADVGFYSGLIESLFSLTQMFVMIFYGRASDRFGRKPILVFSLCGVAFATALFGLAQTIWQMILFRCMAGLFCGSVVTIRTMITEHSTPETQARAFSWFAVSGNLGIFVGPLVGGALAEPATQYPRVFGQIPFFQDYPYALAGLVAGGIGASAAISSALFIEETLPPEKLEGSSSDGTPVRMSTWELTRTPGVAIILFIGALIGLLAFSYTAVVPVFWFTQAKLGGFGFSPVRISMFMALTGASQAVWLLLVFPPLQRRFGTGGVMRGCATAYPVFFLSAPAMNLLLREGSHASRTTFWVLAPVLQSLGVGVIMSATASQLALNDISPSPQTLGTLNALALALSCGVRAFAPALFTTIFAIGVKHQILYGYFVWLVLIVLAVGFTFAARWLPKKAEGKPKPR